MTVDTHAALDSTSRMQLAWWLSWRPSVTIGFGAAVGFAVGNVVTTWTVRAAMLRDGLSPILRLLEPHAGSDGGSLLLLAMIPVVLSLALGAVLGTGVWAWSVVSTRQARDRTWRDLRTACGGRTGVLRADSRRFLDVPTSSTVVGSELRDDEVVLRTWTVSVPEREATLERTDTIATDEVRDVGSIDEDLLEVRTDDAEYIVPKSGDSTGSELDTAALHLQSLTTPPSGERT